MGYLIYTGKIKRIYESFIDVEIKLLSGTFITSINRASYKQLKGKIKMESNVIIPEDLIFGNKTFGFKKRC